MSYAAHGIATTYYDDSTDYRVQKLFLTLSNVGQNEPGLTLEEAVRRLNLQYCTILASQEFHQNGDYHFHFYIEFDSKKVGLSKNTYRQYFEDLFPLFGGRSISSQGVKSVVKTVSYILKAIPTIVLVRFFSGFKDVALGVFYCEFTLSQLCKLTKRTELEIVVSMLKFGSLNE